MTPTKLLIGQILIVFTIVIVGVWSATQWTAAEFAYQSQLGAPVVVCSRGLCSAHLQSRWVCSPARPPGYSNWFADAIDNAALPPQCVTHGLRKAAARRLAEAGCSANEIASITGHRTLKEFERYHACRRSDAG